MEFAIPIAIALLAAAACTAEVPKDEGPSISIRDQTVMLEIVSTPAAKTRGLGYRDSLEWGHGMLFLYEEAPGYPSFWMKGMRFDIDIVWLRDGRIADISHQVRHSPKGNGDTVSPREFTDTVLEVPAGYAQANGWRPGDRATLRHASGDRAVNRSD